MRANGMSGMSGCAVREAGPLGGSGNGEVVGSKEWMRTVDVESLYSSTERMVGGKIQSTLPLTSTKCKNQSLFCFGPLPVSYTHLTLPTKLEV